jgi:hypothetical protein
MRTGIGTPVRETKNQHCLILRDKGLVLGHPAEPRTRVSQERFMTSRKESGITLMTAANLSRKKKLRTGAKARVH